MIGSKINAILSYFSVFTSILMIPVSFYVSAKGKSIEAYFNFFSGILILIEVDRIAGYVAKKFIDGADD